MVLYGGVVLNREFVIFCVLVSVMFSVKVFRRFT